MLCNLVGRDALEKVNIEVSSLNLENTYCLITARSNSEGNIFFFLSPTHTFSVCPSRCGHLPLFGDQVHKREIDAILKENHVKASILLHSC